MPANWSDLSPAERRAWGIEFVGRRHVSARRIRRLRAIQAKTAVAQVNGYVGALAGGGPSEGVAGLAVYERSQVTEMTSGPGNVATERRLDMRVRVDGRAYIRYGHDTISVGLVDLSEGGGQFVLPETSPMLVPGATLDGPILLEAAVTTSRICLNVASRIRWHCSTGAGMHFGVVFGQLDEGETEGIQRFIAAACSRRGAR
jgi:hypothetical protein